MKKILSALMLMSSVMSMNAFASDVNCRLTSNFYLGMITIGGIHEKLELVVGSLGECVDAIFERKLFDAMKMVPSPMGEVEKTVESVTFEYHSYAEKMMIRGEVARPSKDK